MSLQKIPKGAANLPQVSAQTCVFDPDTKRKWLEKNALPKQQILPQTNNLFAIYNALCRFYLILQCSIK
jgi:hypothetical protein